MKRRGRPRKDEVMESLIPMLPEQRVILPPTFLPKYTVSEEEREGLERLEHVSHQDLQWVVDQWVKLQFDDCVPCISKALTKRENCRHRLSKYCDCAALLESTLYNEWFYDHPGVYHYKVRLLEHNLKENGEKLLSMYEPEVLCHLPASTLAQGTERFLSREEMRADLKPTTPRVAKPKGLFRCPKCEGYRTTFFSMQTRSADEPMTNFVHCTVCDIRFKRS
jgi:DNA-directed RNA polymerase subunit M/transcription elongation factor TFIIS